MAWLIGDVYVSIFKVFHPPFFNIVGAQTGIFVDSEVTHRCPQLSCSPSWGIQSLHVANLYVTDSHFITVDCRYTNGTHLAALYSYWEGYISIPTLHHVFLYGTNVCSL